MIKKLLCWFVLAFVVVSCDESDVTPDPVARGLNFYPLEVGDYKIYDVTDIHYQNNKPTETRFQMREWVADSFLDQTNTLTYKIIRSVRPNAESVWVDDSVMVVTKNNSSVILTKDNTKYVKLVFPVKNGKTWEADAFNNNYVNDDEREKHTYAGLDQPYTLDELVYDSTVTVIQGEPLNTVINFDDRKEVYARGIGKIYRLFNRKVFDTCDTEECPDEGEDYILDGHERHEVLIEYGKL
ncbi:hypothetical protein H8S95_04570 [Pontibacter sp. KCTC 32443]|uniref:hypothetical protein n=1 Tax=Pontibacter TaxID=323449 RepID=UPI00164D860E|nr:MULTISPECIES: hypothetical protein [Pontibacter]MBC5773329.1 hypothetical protein [Pontibacter sp. KCTC 32443]